MRGGYGNGEHGTLAERVAATRQSRSGAPAAPSTPARHCLVEGEPGLLVQWARTERGWEGRVVTMAWLDGPAGRGGRASSGGSRRRPSHRCRRRDGPLT